MATTRPSPEEIEHAAARLRAGELVALPTETVYGLGADATNAAAVAKIFAAKGRPSTNPLIVHVADVDRGRRCVAAWTDAADALAAAFWPGPLTIVLPKHASIVNAVTAGRGTVGVRVPNHPVALDLLRAFDGPVAAPSANKSNRVSPTTARHVREEFVELGDTLTVLDGGPCDVGIESTVLDLSGPVPAVLRPGAVTREMIADALRRPLSQVRDGAAVVATDTAAPSPGQHAVHYAPRTPAYRFEPGERERIDLTDAAILGVNLDAEAYARQFYARLRMLDGQGLRAIYVELPPQTAEWAAVRDRITRATRPLADERG